jgi:hypothetical protein
LGLCKALQIRTIKTARRNTSEWTFDREIALFQIPPLKQLPQLECSQAYEHFINPSTFPQALDQRIGTWSLTTHPRNTHDLLKECLGIPDDPLDLFLDPLAQAIDNEDSSDGHEHLLYPLARALLQASEIRFFTGFTVSNFNHPMNHLTTMVDKHQIASTLDLAAWYRQPGILNDKLLLSMKIELKKDPLVFFYPQIVGQLLIQALETRVPEGPGEAFGLTLSGWTCRAISLKCPTEYLNGLRAGALNDGGGVPEIKVTRPHSLLDPVDRRLIIGAILGRKAHFLSALPAGTGPKIEPPKPQP